MRYLALIFVAAMPAFAEEPEFEVMVDTNNYAPQDFQGKGVKATAMPQKPARGAIPEKSSRDSDFDSVKGLDLTGLDELDRDRLYVLARTVEFTQLRKSFPQIPEKPLRALHRKLRK